MLEKHLEAIRDREKAAKTVVREATSRAESIKESAREQGGAHLEGVRADALELQKSLVSKARVEAEDKIAAMRAENAKRIAALSVSSKKNLGKAIEIVMKAFREGV